MKNLRQNDGEVKRNVKLQLFVVPIVRRYHRVHFLVTLISKVLTGERSSKEDFVVYPIRILCVT